MAKGQPTRFSKGQSVGSTSEGHKIIYVLNGYIKRYFVTRSGSIGVQIIYGPQDVFSFTKMYRELLNQSLYEGNETFYYEAMTDVSALTLDIAALKDALNDDPILYKELFAEAGYHLKTCVHRIENISIGNTYARVAHQLLFAASESGKQTPEGIIIQSPHTHQDLADILGITRATVTLAINKLRQRGVLANSRDLIITSLDKLSEEVYPKINNIV